MPIYYTNMWSQGHYYIILWCLILFNVITAGEVGEECSPTEEISKGTCKVITDCKVALSYIQSTLFHPFSRCGFIGVMEIVCCPNNYIQPPTPPTRRSRPNTSIIGQKKYGSGVRIAAKECQKIVASTLPPLESYIIGGKNASLGEFAYMVNLGYNVSGEYEFRCGGSLISDSYVLTAAHCVDTLEGMPVMVRMGVIYIGDAQWNNESDVRIEKIIKHPDRVRHLKYNDIALLKLEHSVVFSPTLSPICLYTKNEDPSVSLTITGWGKTITTRNVRSPYLQKATVVVVSKSKCEEAHPSWRKLPRGISDEQICAGDPMGLRDTCQGDSGGPLQGLTNYDGFPRLVGVTSFGRGCGSPVPGVYTRVSRYLDWIESVVWPYQA